MGANLGKVLKKNTCSSNKMFKYRRKFMLLTSINDKLKWNSLFYEQLF